MTAPLPAPAGAADRTRPPDPWHLGGWLREAERELDRAAPAEALTLFLVGARCPFSCLFCDLAAQTIPGPTPRGAIPEQVRQGLAAAGALPRGAAIKLYNASNFFDERAVPAGDDAEIAALVRDFARVTVECHPRLAGERCFRFAERLDGGLEVAMGLETAAPGALARLGKAMTADDFARAAGELRRRGIAVRAFVLLAPPLVPAGEAVDWAARSVAFAVAAGAGRVTLIPTRGGRPELERLARHGEFRPPTLDELEAALERTVETPGAVVTADLWDAPRLFAGAPRAEERLARLRRMGLAGRREPPLATAVAPA